MLLQVMCRATASATELRYTQFHRLKDHAQSPIGANTQVYSQDTHVYYPVNPVHAYVHTELTERRVGKWLCPLAFCQCLENLCPRCSVPPNLSVPIYKSLHGAKPLALWVCQNQVGEDIGTSKWGVLRTTSD